ncbi:hypothetical protein AOLI_G00195320 [Acnodon oligacanthus]
MDWRGSFLNWMAPDILHRVKSMEDTRTKRIIQTQHSGSRYYRLTAVCLGLLCVLLLTAITVLWIKFTTERDQLQTSYTNLTVERDQLQTSYTNLTVERDQLQTSYTNRTIELHKERDEFKRKFSELERFIKQLGWSYFSSSLYYISTEEKSWEFGKFLKPRSSDIFLWLFFCMKCLSYSGPKSGLVERSRN